jgi:hypothetical protein
MKRSLGAMGGALGIVLAALVTQVASANAIYNHVSNGSDGAFMPTVSTVLDSSRLVFNFTDFYIPSGVTVSFSGVAAAQPIELLATGNIDIAGALDGGANSLLIGTAGNITVSGSLDAIGLALIADTVDLTAASSLNLAGNNAPISGGTGPLSCGPNCSLSVGNGNLADVPEPQTLALTALGLAALGLARRRSAS